MAFLKQELAIDLGTANTVISQSVLPLEVPEGFSGRDYFADYYGVNHPEGVAETVELKVDRSQVAYFRSLELHPTQEEVETGEVFSVFRFRLVPNYKFLQEILSKGSMVEVLSTVWLRDEVREEIKRMASLYD